MSSNKYSVYGEVIGILRDGTSLLSAQKAVKKFLHSAEKHYLSGRKTTAFPDAYASVPHKSLPLLLSVPNMKKIIIMGASSGIGYAVARAFAEQGFRVGIAARRTDTLKALKARFPEQIEYASIDVNDPAGVQKLYNLAKALGGMDIYFHVAGIGYDNPTLDPEREATIVNTDATGFARMICAAYSWFSERGLKGHIAAVTSVAGTKGIGRMAAYSASKKFGQTYLVALEQLAREEKSGITFTDVRPGWIKTPLLADKTRFPLEMSIDYAVPRIIKAIVHKRRVAVIDWRWHIVTGLWRLIPDRLWTRMHIRLSDPDILLPRARRLN